MYKSQKIKSRAFDLMMIQYKGTKIEIKLLEACKVAAKFK